MLRLAFLLTAIIAYTSLAQSQGFGSSQLLHEWEFRLEDEQAPQQSAYNSNEIWQDVVVPHDWSVAYPASPDNASCTGYLPGGIGWYRTELDIPNTRNSNRYYLYFEGVYNRSEVFVNQQSVGYRPNGYVSFLYDITEFVSPGEQNQVEVRVDHSLSADSRWYTGSGIYRPVHLITANPVHLDLWGVHYYTETDSDGETAVVIETKIQNHLTDAENQSPGEFRIVQTLYDDSGKTVSSVENEVTLRPGSENNAQAELSVPEPKLWSVDSPYLYKLETTLLSNETVVDSSTTTVGIRTLTFDPDKGFALNGESMKVKGVCLHHDAGVLGAAVPKIVWRERLLKLKELGCNAIRMSHNPQATALYDLCDELGFLVMDEAFDEWEYPKKKWLVGWNKGEPGFQGSADFFEDWAERDLAAMVKRDRNHPSIIMWSIGNEVDYPNDPYSHPILDEEGIGQHHVAGYQEDQPPAERLSEISKRLAAVVRQHDLSRPVTAALAGAVMSNETEYPYVLDIVGYNYTENRYHADHVTYPERVLYGSETRHDYAAWRAVKDNEFIFGQFLWTGFDYLGEAGPWPSRGFTTGLIDLANNIKPRGHFRRALWAEEPVVYLGTYRPRNPNTDYLSVDAGRSWNYKEGENIRVVCYTNGEAAHLELNGSQIGEKKNYDSKTGIIFWDIPYQPGQLKVTVYQGSEAVTTDTISTDNAPKSLNADTANSVLKNKYDVAVVPISVVDRSGNLIYEFDEELVCEIKGPGKLLGIENASTHASDNFLDNKAAFKHGRLTLYVQATADHGKVELTLRTPNLKTKKIRLPIK